MLFPVIIATRIRSEAGSDTVAPVIQSASWSAGTGLSVTILEADSLPVDLFIGTYDRGSEPSLATAVVAGTGAYDAFELADNPAGPTTGTFDLPNTPDGDRAFAIVARDNAGNLSSVSTVDFVEGSAAPNLISNGTFDSATDWEVNSNTTISGGTLNFLGNSQLCRQYDPPLTDGASYDVSFDLTRSSGTGTVFINMGGTASASYESGAISFTITNGSTNNQFRIVPTSDFIGTVDNVVVAAA